MYSSGCVNKDLCGRFLCAHVFIVLLVCVHETRVYMYECVYMCVHVCEGDFLLETLEATRVSPLFLAHVTPAQGSSWSHSRIEGEATFV